MPLENWILLGLACLGGAASPGPSLALVSRASINEGRYAGIIIGISHGFGILIYAGLTSFGLTTLLLLSRDAGTFGIFSIVQLAGIGFLGWISIGMIRAGWQQRLQPVPPHLPHHSELPSSLETPIDSHQPSTTNHLEETIPPPNGRISSISAGAIFGKSLHRCGTHARDGFLIAFLNPKIAVFFLAIFSQFLSPEQGPAVRTGMAVLAWAIDTAWYIFATLVLTLPVIRQQLQQLGWRLDLAMGLGLASIALLLLLGMLSG